VLVSGLVPEPAGYAELLEQLKARVRASQVRAARAANSELLALYWSVGRDILDRQEQAGWGSRVIDRLATDCARSSPTSGAGHAATCTTCELWPKPGLRALCSRPLHDFRGAA
jgi:hypothetical protein